MGTLILTKTKKNMNAIQTIVILLLAASISCQSALEAQNAEIAVPKVQPVAREEADSPFSRELVKDAHLEENVVVRKEQVSSSRSRLTETAERILGICEQMCKEVGTYPKCPQCPDFVAPDATPGVMTWDELLCQMDNLKKWGRKTKC